MRKPMLFGWGLIVGLPILLVLTAKAQTATNSNIAVASASRDVSRPVPVEVPLATLPVFRKESRSLPAVKTAPAVTRSIAFVQTKTASLDAGAGVFPLSPWITGLTADVDGNIWVSTEDAGVYRFNPNLPDKPGARYGAEQGVDDHLYAIACDGLGRIWVGSLSRGVFVFNGARWHNYDAYDIMGASNGPLGSRIFRIKVSPTDGDVWISSSGGLSRYSMKQDAWTYYTQADGLPSDQIQALAFDTDGTLYAGSACDGLAICTPELSTSSQQPGQGRLEYKTWRVVEGPGTLPVTPTGDGLPTRLINDILVASSGVIYIGTTTGLAWSSDHGKTFGYVRGQDYSAKVNGLSGGPPAGWKEMPGATLAEDYVTCLAEDPGSGLIWVGFRQSGCGLLDPATMRYMPLVTDAYAREFLVRKGQSPLLGGYWDGLISPSENAPKSFGALTASISASATTSTAVSLLPSPAKPPTLADLNSLLQEIGSVPSIAETNQPVVVALEDDWRTRGDWLGRYGRYWMCYAAISDGDYLWGAGPDPVSYAARMGSNCQPGDSLRYWIQWMYTDDPRCLELPPVYLDRAVVKQVTTSATPRRAAEWDDHGEGYPLASAGPNVYCTLRIPQGRFYLSLYELNAAGNVTRHRYRDLIVSIRAHDSGTSLKDIDGFPRQSDWAHARVRDFYGGVWKRFLVRGPTELTVEIDRNYSFNSLLPAVALDLVDEDPPPYFHTGEEWIALNAARNTALLSLSAQDFQTATNESEAVTKMVTGLQHAQLVNPEWWAANQGKYFTLLGRWLTAGQSPPPEGTKGWVDTRVAASTRTILYHLHNYDLWEQMQRVQGLVPARDLEKALRWDGGSTGSGMGGRYIAAQAAAMVGGN